MPDTYRRLIRIPAVRHALWLGMLLRTPIWAFNLVLTVHVVDRLHRGYAAAGTVTMLVTVAMALSGPWRGRMLDRVGLRRTVLPGLVVQVGCWIPGVFAPYPVLLVLAPVAALFMPPSFPILRQVLIAAVSDEDRTAALALDSVAVELTFMTGPVLGIVAAQWVGTPAALLGCLAVSALGAVALCVVDPPLHPDHGDEPGPTPADDAPPGWLSRPVVAVMLVTIGAAAVLTGTDVAIIAALRSMGRQPAIGWVMAIWGGGSAVGGLAYGALRRSLPPAWLLAGLALATVPAVLGTSPWPFALLLFVGGLFCAPTITATVDLLAALVPAARRGEAMGWHGSAITSGSALGAPLAGAVIDLTGWRGGLLLSAGCGLLAVAAALATDRGVGRVSASSASDAAPGRTP